MHDHIYLTRKYHAKSFYTFILAISFSRMGRDSYAEPASDSYLVGVTFPAPDRVGDSNESLFFHGAVAVTYVCNCRHAWLSQGRAATLSLAFKLLPGRLPAGTPKFEFQRAVLTIAQVNRGRNARDAKFISIQA